MGCRARFQSNFVPPGLPNPSLSSLGGFKDHSDQFQSASFRRKLWKANKKEKRLVLGNDVGLEETCRMDLCSLVGRLSYKSLRKGSLEEWINLQWLSLLGYYPEVIFFTKGWLGFICNSPEDATLLLNSL